MPTLTIGYSVKSRGIARDLFGTDNNFVLPYQNIISKDMIQKNFHWITMHTSEIQEILKKKTVTYQQEINKMGEKLKKMYVGRKEFES